MKKLLIVPVMIVWLTLGCAPSDDAPPAVEPTPAAEAEGKITEMDFESGEAEQATEATEETPPESDPETP